MQLRSTSNSITYTIQRAYRNANNFLKAWEVELWNQFQLQGDTKLY